MGIEVEQVVCVDRWSYCRGASGLCREGVSCVW